MCNSYPCVLFQSLSHVINQKSHVFSWNFGKIYLVHFLKFWSLLRFTQEISKLRKSELGKFIQNFPLKYVITSKNRVRDTRYSNNILAIYTRHNYFNNLFFPCTISEWDSLDCIIRNSQSPPVFFKKKLLNFIRPCANSIFNIHISYGIKALFSRYSKSIMWLAIILKQQHTFFSTAQVFILLDKPSWITLETSTSRFYLTSKIEGNSNCNLTVNRFILNATIEYLITTERLKCPLLN